MAPAAITLKAIQGFWTDFIVAAQFAVEDAQSGMGQGIVGLVGNEALQLADGLLQFALLLQFDRLVIPLFDSRHSTLAPRFVETAVKPQSNGRGTEGKGLSEDDPHPGRMGDNLLFAACLINHVGKLRRAAECSAGAVHGQDNRRYTRIGNQGREGATKRARSRLPRQRNGK
jgi:hypothetical protein